MKVLWFANTPCNADEYFNTELKGTGGWLKALDRELQNHVDLHVAFCPAITVTFFPKGIVNFFIALNRSTYKDFIIFMYPLLSVLIL